MGRTTKHDDLERLDSALGRVRRLWDRPGVRRWFQDHLDLEQTDATLYRTLRAVRVAAGTSGPPSIGEVAIAMHVDPSTASRFVDRAVAAGLVQRTATPVDRRRTALELTEIGRARLTALRDARVQFLAELTRTWPAADRRRFTELLEGFDVLADELEHDGDD